MSEHDHERGPAAERRTFLGATTSLAMAGGLAASYGAFGLMAARYLYPAHDTPRGWLFVCEAHRLEAGKALSFTTPSGQTLVIARQGAAESAESFIALSSVCPHLGCQVHWEPQNDRFFCPCHNGVFDPAGKATEGPPAKANQSLLSYPLKIDNGLLFVEAPLEGLAAATPAGGGGEVC